MQTLKDVEAYTECWSVMRRQYAYKLTAVLKGWAFLYLSSVHV